MPFNPMTGRVLTIFDPEQNAEVEVLYLNNKRPTIPFGCLAHDHVGKENYESKKAYWEKKRAVGNAARAAIQERMREEHCQCGLGPAQGIFGRACADHQRDQVLHGWYFVQLLGYGLEGGFVALDKGQKGNEHIGHMIRPHRGPLIILPEDQALFASDVASGKIISIRMRHME
mmetsp:Transcript_15049/g.43505  ORF Transcript_15049/g.43505 Transcript_15049/m.43505 type:complete len:173 (-) Transcript_15049:106-624(-)